MQTNTCLNTDTATKLLLGKLPPEEAEVVEEHLLDCNDCLELAQSIDAEDGLLKSLKSNHDESETRFETTSSYSDLVGGLEALGSAAQLAASAGAEIKSLLLPPQQEDEIGRLLHFHIKDVLGAGGMGIVFRANDDALQRTVALKAMRPSLAVDPDARARFRREAMSIAAFEHDHIVTIYQVEEDNGIPFFTMPLLEGETLRERLRREEKLSPDESVRITREIALGLAAAHDRGLLHRDIKPDNIWLETPDDRVKILDFGLVRSVEERSSLTHSGTILGTPEYMAPEQACGENVDERCDLFSLGCVLYHMLTGQPPFRGKNVVATLVAISNANVEPPKEIDPSIPSSVSDLTTQLLQREPEKRLESAEELIAGLDDCATPSNKLRVSTRDSSATRPPAIWKWLACGLLAAGAFAGVVAWQTNYGTLHIDAGDGVQTKIQGDSVRILDTRSNRKLALSVGENKLRPGEYEIIVADESAKLEFSTREFTIRRFGDKHVRIWLTPDEHSSTKEIASDSVRQQHRQAQQKNPFREKMPRLQTQGATDAVVDLGMPEATADWIKNPSGSSTQPAWHHGVSSSPGIKAGESISPLSLVSQPNKRLPYVSWTLESRNHRRGVTDISLSPNSELLATAGADGTVRIWKCRGLEDAELKHVLVCPRAEKLVRSVAWSHDGNYLAAACDQSVCVWLVSATPDKLVCQFKWHVSRRAKEIAWSPRENKLAISDTDGIHLFHADSGQIQLKQNWVGDMSQRPWSPDGEHFVHIVDGKGVIQVRELRTNLVDKSIKLRAPTGHTMNFVGPVYNPSGQYVATGINHIEGGKFKSSEIIISYLTGGTRAKSFRRNVAIEQIAWRSDGEELNWICKEEKVHLLDLLTGREPTLRLPMSAHFDETGVQRVRWLKVQGQEYLCVVHAGIAWVRVDDDWKQLAGPETVANYDFENGNMAAQVFHGPLPEKGNDVAASSIEIWNVSDMKRLASIDAPSTVWFKLSPDGKLLATQKGDLLRVSGLNVYDVLTGKRLASMELALSRNGSRPVWVGNDRLLCRSSSKATNASARNSFGRGLTNDRSFILDARTGKELKSWTDPRRTSFRSRDAVTATRWSSDGRSYFDPVSASLDRSRLLELHHNPMDTSVAGYVLDAVTEEKLHTLRIGEPDEYEKERTQRFDAVRQLKATMQRQDELIEGLKRKVKDLAKDLDIVPDLSSGEERPTMDGQLIALRSTHELIMESEFQIADLKSSISALESVSGKDAKPNVSSSSVQVLSNVLPDVVGLRKEVQQQETLLEQIELTAKAGKDSKYYKSTKQELDELRTRLDDMVEKEKDPVRAKLEERTLEQLGKELAQKQAELDRQETLKKTLERRYEELKARRIGDGTLEFEFAVQDLSRALQRKTIIKQRADQSLKQGLEQDDRRIEDMMRRGGPGRFDPRQFNGFGSSARNGISPPTQYAWSDSGRWFAIVATLAQPGPAQASLFLWDLDSDSELPVRTAVVDRDIYKLAFSPSEELLLMALPLSSRRKVQFSILDVQTGETVYEIEESFRRWISDQRVLCSHNTVLQLGTSGEDKGYTRTILERGSDVKFDGKNLCLSRANTVRRLDLNLDPHDSLVIQKRGDEHFLTQVTSSGIFHRFDKNVPPLSLVGIDEQNEFQFRVEKDQEQVELETRRKAVAMVVLPDDDPDDGQAWLFPVDGDSVLLDPQYFTPRQANSYPRINVGQTHRDVPIGVKWRDGKVSDAARIAEMLKEDWDELGKVLFQIELLNEGGTGGQEFVIRGRSELGARPAGLSVRWGRAPGKELEDEPTAEDKLRLLLRSVRELPLENEALEIDLRSRSALKPSGE